jgi:hypothetical protein
VSACPDCGQTYRATAGHCRGGRFGGCCRSFEESQDFDRHRTGGFHDGSRRCLTDAEMVEKGWTRVEHRWLSPQGTARRVARERGALSGAEVAQ